MLKGNKVLRFKKPFLIKRKKTPKSFLVKKKRLIFAKKIFMELKNTFKSIIALHQAVKIVK